TPGLVEREVASGTLRQLKPVDLPEAQSTLALVSLRDRTFSPLAAYAAAFVEDLASRIRDGACARGEVSKQPGAGTKAAANPGGDHAGDREHRRGVNPHGRERQRQ